MPKQVRISDPDLRWLQKNHKSYSYSDLAQRVGCCVDTLKRILVREGLQEFDGAKYQVRRDFSDKTWTRPCMSCRSTEERPMGYED